MTVLWYPEDYPPVTNHLELVRMLEELTEPYGFKVSQLQSQLSCALDKACQMMDAGVWQCGWC